MLGVSKILPEKAGAPAWICPLFLQSVNGGSGEIGASRWRSGELTAVVTLTSWMAGIGQRLDKKGRREAVGGTHRRRWEISRI
jgi:hypothetical protein